MRRAPAWPGADAKPGQPDRDLAACLQQQAYAARALPIPVTSATAGIIAQCEIRVDQLQGGSPPVRDSAVEAAISQQATAAVVRYRASVGR